MTKLPVVSGQVAITALSQIGFQVKRQKGSHVILRRDDPFAQVVGPDHKVLDRGTLKSILRGASISAQEFSVLL